MSSRIEGDLAKSVQICKHPIKFGKASNKGTAMPLLMKQIGMSCMKMYSNTSTISCKKAEEIAFSSYV